MKFVCSKINNYIYFFSHQVFNRQNEKLWMACSNTTLQRQHTIRQKSKLRLNLRKRKLSLNIRIKLLNRQLILKLKAITFVIKFSTLITFLF
jgi:hypothetical protein